MNHQSNRKDLSLWALLTALVFLPNAYAESQENEQEAATQTSVAVTTDEDSGDTAPDPVEEIVTIGTRLQVAPAGSPVFSIDRLEIDRRGLRSIEEVIRYIPQNFSSIVSGGSFAGGSPRFSQGAVSVNLRGLGEGTTLVLVNGRRIAPTPAESGTYTDVSTIPFSAIERVEVMPDGGSAIYGSDAVGGVINFVLKQGYRGSETSARYESSSSGGDRFSIEQSFGATWGSGNITGSISYDEEDPVLPEDADFNWTGDYRAQGGRFFSTARGQPAVLGRGGRFLPPGAPPGSLYAILPSGDGTNINPDEIIYVSRQENTTQTGNYLLLPPGSPISTGWLTPKRDKLSGYLSFSQEFGQSFEFGLDAIYSEQSSISNRYTNLISDIVPPSNYYNPFGVPVWVNYTTQNEIAAGLLEPAATENDATRFNVNASLNWKIPFKDWEALFTYSVGEDETVNADYRTNWRTPAFYAAIASPDPNTALNVFGDGTAQLSSIAELVTDRDTGSRVSEQEAMELALGGTLFELPGGGLELSLGLEQRTDTLDFDTFVLNPFTFFIPDAPPVVPESENQAMYLEVGIPLIGASNARPWARSLRLHFAFRDDEYEIEGAFDGALEPNTSRSYGDSSTKFGIEWKPIDRLRIRASQSEAFLAPTLQELFRPPDMFPFPMTDPFNPASNGGPFALVFPTTIFGGNPGLEGQTSETQTFGFDFETDGFEGFYLSATWTNIEFENVIGDLFILGFPPLPALEHPERYPGLVERDANGVLTLLSFQPANLGRRDSESIDFQSGYRFNTGFGDFDVGVTGTKTLKLDVQAVVGADVIEQAGTDNGPDEWRTNAYVDWTRGDWTAGATLVYAGSYENTDPNALQKTVDGYTTLDVQAGYRLPNSGWRFSLGVQNLFDEDFPFVDSFQGVSSRHADFRRRIVYLDATWEFAR